MSEYQYSEFQAVDRPLTEKEMRELRAVSSRAEITPSHFVNLYIGTWRIYAMELWDADYFDMEVQAFVEIRPDNLGSFQFGLVSGALYGYLEGAPPRQRFAFTWEGNDERDLGEGCSRAGRNSTAPVAMPRVERAQAG